MLIAAVDTSTLTLSCALLEIDSGAVRVLAERSEQAPSRGAVGGHSGRLPVVLVELLEESRLVLADVEGYAVGIGPGSFTGLRIGLATWKGLAYAARRPIAGASSLAALALAAAPRAPENALLVPLLDAKRGELYAGFYRVDAAGRVESIAPEAALGPDALVAYLWDIHRRAEWSGSGPFGFGQGWNVYGHALGPALLPLPAGPETPSAAAVGRLAAPALVGAAFDLDRLSALEPHYVRPSEAELRFPQGLGP